MSENAPLTPATVGELSLEFEFDATAEAVWRALTEDLDTWWPDAFYMCAGPGPKRMTIDATPGGHMLEEAGGGNGMIWGTVVHVQAGAVLELTGSYGSPLTWFGSYQIEALGEGAKLRFTERMFGRVTEAELASKDQGWRFLYDGCMRAHLEGTPPPAWESEPGGSC